MSLPADVELIGVTKRYDGGAVAVDGVSLRIPPSSYCCLLGPSGCGKTSTLRMIAGHEEVSDGDILIRGENVAGRPPGRRGTAMMFQSYALFPHLSCLDNVAFSLKMRGIRRAERLARAREHLALVDMTAYADRLPTQLSGGQQQRVALARALVTGPRVLLLDEEAMALADLVVVMEGGRVQQAAPPREVFERPATAFVARFIGGHNVLPQGNRLVAVRADRCRLGAPGNGSPDGPHVSGRVSAVEYQGPTVRVAVAAGGDETVALLPDALFHAAPVAVGDPATLTWSPADAHAIEPT